MEQGFKKRLRQEGHMELWEPERPQPLRRQSTPERLREKEKGKKRVFFPLRQRLGEGRQLQSQPRILRRPLLDTTVHLTSHVNKIELTSQSLIHPPSNAHASAAQMSCSNIDFEINSLLFFSPREKTSSYPPNGGSGVGLNNRARSITLNDRVHKSLTNRDIDKYLNDRDFSLTKEPCRGSTASHQWDTISGITSLNRDSSLVNEPRRGSEQEHPLPNIEIPSWVYMESRPNLEHMLQVERLLVSSLNFAALVHAAENYRAGNFKNFIANWEYLTSDREIMSIIKYCLRLDTKHYIAPRERIQYHLPDNEIRVMDNELIAMCKKGMIRKTKSTPGDYFSPIFIREKSNGGTRMILNLKQLDKNIQKNISKWKVVGACGSLGFFDTLRLPPKES